ncbi:MAG: DUF4199 domain-containing protein [bacterium]|nr:DUF4199 domain-containing protein [Candidatus Colousia faecequi]
MSKELNRHAMSKGLVLGSLFALNYVLSTYSATSFLSFGVEIVIVYFAYKAAVDCRENVLEGVISFGGAWWYVINLFLYSSMVGGVVKYVYLKFIRPDYLQGLIPQVKAVFEQAQMSGGEMKEVMTTLGQVLTPENMVLYSIMGDVLIGIFLGLIIGLIVKRDETYRHNLENN